ncbi:MAG: methyltransferase domain-containing protein [Planctomycetia bacterium]|nr:methyltransferase domain-containing protein [Planctomycetia bacterium]
MPTQLESALETKRAAGRLPEYAVEMKNFHCAFATELKGIVDALPLAPHMHVIDVGCGDGFYMELFASRLNDRGAVTGLDSNGAYLEIARKRLAQHSWLCHLHFVQGPLQVDVLPRGVGDLAWCAQSLFSLPEPSHALRSMAQAVHPGGFVAVLENDCLHQVLLPWPPGLELAVRTAELSFLISQAQPAPKHYVARRLPELFAEAGLEPLETRVCCTMRGPPFGEHLTAFLQAYLDRLARRVAGRLDRSQARELAALIDHDSDEHLLRKPWATIGWLNTVVWGRRP